MSSQDRPSATGSYDHAEIAAMTAFLREGSRPECPRCLVVLDRRVVQPRSDVSYVRDRVLLVCPSCHRTAVVDWREDG